MMTQHLRCIVALILTNLITAWSGTGLFACSDESAYPDGQPFGVFEYHETEQGVEIIGYPNDQLGHVEIPGEINGKPVIGIGGRSLNGCDIRLGYGAFDHCHRITGVTIPHSVTSIGEEAFLGCQRLTSVTIPAGVTEIGDSSFASCLDLEEILVASDNSQFIGVDGVLFSADMSCLIQFPAGKGGSYVIPESVTRIGRGAFRDCVRLTKIVIPEGVTSIGRFTFSGCRSLTSIQLPESLLDLEPLAFEGCTELASVTIPRNVKTIGIHDEGDVIAHFEASPFAGCFALEAIEVDSRNQNHRSVGGVLFWESRNTLTHYPSSKNGSTYVIPEGIRSIDRYAFSNSISLTEITIPSTVTWIDSGAFEHCNALTSITIPKEASVISNAFSNCRSLMDIWVEEGHGEFRSIDGVLFSADGTSLLRYPPGRFGDYTVSDEVTAISGGAFAGCHGLTKIAIPESVTDIGQGVFEECASLKSIHVDPGNGAFASIEGVLFDVEKQVLIRFPGGKSGGYDIPFGVTEVATGAFSGSQGLSRISINEDLTRIGYGAFENCGSLLGVSLVDHVMDVRARAFYGCSKLIGVTLGENVVGIGSNAFGECPRLSCALFLGDAVEDLGKDAFSGAAAGFSVHYRPERSGFTSSTWNGYAASAVIEPSDLVVLHLRNTPYGIEMRWRGPENALYQVYYSYNLKDWTLANDSAIRSVGGGLAVYEEAGITRAVEGIGFYRAELIDSEGPVN